MVLLESMAKAKLSPSVVSFSAAISACEQDKKWQEALELFEKMLKAQVQQDLVSYLVSCGFLIVDFVLNHSFGFTWFCKLSGTL